MDEFATLDAGKFTNVILEHMLQIKFLNASLILLFSVCRKTPLMKSFLYEDAILPVQKFPL